MLNYLSNFIPFINEFIKNLLNRKKRDMNKISIIDNIYENEDNIILKSNENINTYRILLPIQILTEPDEVFWTSVDKVYLVNTVSKSRAIELIKNKYKIFMLEEHKNIGNPDIKYIDRRAFKLDKCLTKGISYVDNPLQFRNNFFNYIENNTEKIT